MPINFKKDVLPHLLGVISFYLITIAYFSPIVFDGKMMFQTDILQWEGSAKEVLEYRAQTGEEALWTNRMFGGMPAYLIHTQTKGDITNALVKVITLGLPHPIGSLFFGMVGMYLLLLSFKVRPLVAMIAAWAFALNTFNLLSLEAGHNAKIWAVCIIPMIFVGIHLTFKRKWILGLAITAFAVMMQMKFNHLQITYYTLLIVLLYIIAQFVVYIKKGAFLPFIKVAALLLIAAVIGAGGNAARLASIMEYGQYSIRGEKTLATGESQDDGLDKTYAFNWSQGKMESFTLLIPYFQGGASTEQLPKNSASEQALRAQGVEGAQINQFVNNANTYWGDQPMTGGPIYGSAIMIFFMVLAIFFAPPLYRKIFLGMALFTLMLAWGKNLSWFNYLLFDLLPGFNKFRAVSMALGTTLFAIPVAGALGLEGLFQQAQQAHTKKRFFISLAIVVGLILFAVIAAGMMGYRGNVDTNFPEWLQDALQEDRKKMLRSDAVRSIVLIGLTAGLLFTFLLKKMDHLWVCLGVAVLLLIDVWGVNRRYLDDESFTRDPSDQYFAATPADNRIMQDDGYFRVLNLQNPFNEARTSYRFNSIGGYHGAKLRRYQDLIERSLSPEMESFIQKAQEGELDFDQTQVLNMLNTKYILAGRSENAVIENPNINGSAWFPKEITVVESNEEEIDQLNSINTKEKAVVQGTQGLSAGEGEISLKSYAPNRLVYEARVVRNGLAVFSEIYYPEGWKAFIDGEEAEIIRVNYLLRGMDLPEGNAEVEMKFEPSGYQSWALIMVLLQYVVVVFLVVGIVFYLKNQN